MRYDSPMVSVRLLGVLVPAVVVGSFAACGNKGDGGVIFINNHLVVDLGGVHAAMSAPLDVDAKAAETGIAVGNVYPFDMFQAERHTTESNFRADTNLEFVDCGTIVPEVPK